MLTDLSNSYKNRNNSMKNQNEKLVHFNKAEQFCEEQNLFITKMNREILSKKSNSNAFSVSNIVKDSFNFLFKDWISVIQTPYISQNIIAGITVAAVALPLNVALALAAGLPATSGLMAGAVGGAIAAIFGGSRFQATGPAAALNAMVFVVVQKFGIAGAAATAMLVGLIQILLSLFSAGTLIKFVPEAVLLGFTTGVGIKLLDSQLPKLFGIDWSLYQMINDITNPIWLHEVSLPAVVCGLFVLFFILACKAFAKFPAALIAIAITTQLAIFLNWPIHKVGEIPPVVFNFALPHFTNEDWFKLFQLAIPLGLLAAAESVLSAQAIDRMSGDKHHSNLEIMGQGLANLGSGLVGGMPVSGVIVRSSVNVQSGAKNRLGSLFHCLFLFFAALFLTQVIAKIPLASLAGLLCIIGFRLIEFKELFHSLKSNLIMAMAFIFAMIGTVTDHIVWGLAVGLAIVAIANFIQTKISKNILENNLANKKINPVKISTEENTVNTIANNSKVSSHKFSSSKKIVINVLDRGEQWLHHLKQQASVPNTSYIHPNASVIGRVVLGKNVHIAAESSVRADEGTPFYIGDNSNVQDGVVIHALKQKWIDVQNQKWAVYIGKDVSLAHQALVHGPCYIGDNSFIGFKAVVHDSILAQGCYVGIGAIVVGVEVPEERYIPHGSVIDSQEKANQLLKVSPQHQHFNEDVVEVNKGLVEAYHELQFKSIKEK